MIDSIVFNINDRYRIFLDRYRTYQEYSLYILDGYP